MVFCDKVEVMIQEIICHWGTNYVHYIRNSTGTAMHCAPWAKHCSALHCYDREFETSSVIFRKKRGEQWSLDIYYQLINCYTLCKILTRNCYTVKFRSTFLWLKSLKKIIAVWKRLLPTQLNWPRSCQIVHHV